MSILKSVFSNLIAITLIVLISGCTTWKGGIVTQSTVDYLRFAPLEITEFDPPEGVLSVGAHSTCVTVSSKFPQTMAFEKALSELVLAANNMEADGAAGLDIDRDVICSQGVCHTIRVCISAELWMSKDSEAQAKREARKQAEKSESEKWAASYLSEGWNHVSMWKVTKVMKPSEAKEWFKDLPGELNKKGQLYYKEFEGFRYVRPVVEYAEFTIVSIEKI